jgi:hypothetical protein
VTPLHHVAVVRLVERLSTSFSCIKLPRFYALTPAVSPTDVERMLVLAVQKGQARVRVDHRAQVRFFLKKS